MGVFGNTRWGVVLCSFQDIIAKFDRDPAYLKGFFNQTGAGKGGLFNYWHDMSYGNIDLTNSDVFGPYRMQYSYGKDYGLPREAYVTEAIRILVKEHGINVSPYYGFVAVVNGIVDGSSGPVDLDGIRSAAGVDLRPGTWGIVVTTSATMDQPGWKWCRQCYGLWYSGGATTGKCPNPIDSSGGHAGDISGNYIVLHNLTTFAGQAGWSRCRNCQGLWYSGGATSGGQCPNGGEHDSSGSLRYQVALNLANFPNTGSPPSGGQKAWRWCKACAGFWYGGSVSDPRNPNDPGLGSCPATKKGHILDLDAAGRPRGDYTLLFVQSDIGNLNYTAHEMGHGYTLDHANVETPLQFHSLFGSEYGDNYCIMGSSPTYPGPNFPNSGSGLAGTSRDKLGWIRSDRVWTWNPSAAPDPSAGANVLLAGLDTPEGVYRTFPAFFIGNVYLLAKIVLPERILTIEFRKKAGLSDPAGTPPWDSALPRDGVIIRELRTWGTFGQQNWKYCSRCHGLAYAGLTGTCPAGGNHEFSGSFNYSIMRDVSVPISNYCDDNWRWCNQCQCLTYAPPNAPAGPCRNGTQHNHAGSSAYALLAFVGAGENKSQQLWTRCDKCQTLFYSGDSPMGVCFADGGQHATGAGLAPNYTLMTSENFQHTFLLPDGSSQDWQAGREFIHDGANVRIRIDEFYKDSPVARITVSQLRNEEPRWWWCSKCFSLVYWHTPGDTTMLRRCPAGLQHELTHSWEYRLTHATSAVAGQQRWYKCSKCFALVYGGNPDLGVCLEAPGRQHTLTGATEYQLDMESGGVAGQKYWRWCSKCEELWWSGGVRNPSNPDDPGYGRCPAGARHTVAGSGSYLLRHGEIWP